MKKNQITLSDGTLARSNDKCKLCSGRGIVNRIDPAMYKIGVRDTTQEICTCVEFKQINKDK